MRIDTPIVVGILSFIAAMAGVYATVRNASRANKQSINSSQLAWTQGALADAKVSREETADALKEAKAARKMADEANERLEAVERSARQMATQIGDVMAWVNRVVRYAQQMRSDSISDPATIRLLAIINGGPPEISDTQLQRPEGANNVQRRNEDEGR